MLNKVSTSNADFSSSTSSYEKKYIQPQDFGSPKFMRKRQESTAYLGRIIEKRTDPQTEPIIFISPKKYLEHQNGGTDSFRSISSVSSVGYIQGHRNNIISAQSATINISSLASLVQPRVQGTKTFETAEEIIARMKANKDVIQIKTKTENLDKKIASLNEQIKSLKEENNYLYSKIEDFNGIIGEKNEIINHFSIMLKQKQQNIVYYENQIQYLKRKNQQFQAVIVLLNKSVEECSKCSCNNITVETEDGQREKEGWEQEIQKYKGTILELNTKMKYLQIQSNMLQKIRYDLEIQMSKNEKLKIDNRKLLSKIEQLTEKLNQKAKNIPSRYDKRTPVLGRLNEREKRQSQISLELSPQK